MTEQIVPETPKVATPKKKIAAAMSKLKQLPKKQMVNLGAEPVVLVPASKKSKAQQQLTVADASENAPQVGTSTADNGLYGTKYIVDAPASDAATPAVPKKKRNVFDYLQGENADPSAQTASSSVADAAPKKTTPIVPQKPVAPVQQASAATSGYVAQLASFRSNAEATAEFGRLRSKYGDTLAGLSPVISQGEVAGSTRYRLAVGPFASRDAANALCSKLFAAGERDCLVRN